MVRGDLTVP